ncbi:MAG: LysM peptidoglycan-binding domain-containing protein [Akkermansiaceae bacterium]|nr:LysM peptidoglycan-binding domain-containing protein [Akkermansiaceae bacterium]
MKLIYSILSVVGCCSAFATTLAQDNYSLWPRRPEELEQARALLTQQKWAEAVHLLRPFVHDSGVAGVEARKMSGRVNVVRYLSRMHPYSSVYTVKRGDTLPKIAATTKCPTDLLMLYNGLVAPSALKVGQKIVYVEMSLRMEIYPELNELTVWDGDALVASYKIEAIKGVSENILRNSVTTVSSRDAYIQGKKIPSHAAQSAVADKSIRLADGVIVSSFDNSGDRYIRLSLKDLNELAQLIRVGNEVRWKETPS